MRRLAAFLVCVNWASVSAAEVVVPSRVIRAGETVSSRDLELRHEEAAGVVTSMEAVIGLEALVTLYPARPIRPDQLGAPAVITRNQTVTIIYAGAGLLIEAEGRALDRGALGDTVRVMNLSSRRTVAGSVRGEGSILVGGSK